METKTSSLPGEQIRLRDGRQLAYAEYGDPQGKPIFFFHGTPGSRLFHHPDSSIALSIGARVIAVDRPGFGRSDFKPGRTLLDWPNDVVELADALNIGQFAVIGYSAGGAYAAACAARIPHRLTAAGLISSIAPMDNPRITRGMQGMSHMFFTLDRHVPPLARFGCWVMCTSWQHNPEQYYKSQINGFDHSEKAQGLLTDIETMLTADLLEAVRGGTEGISSDLALLARPWGFHLHAIATNVFLWHGESDNKAPLAMGKRLASAIPRCRATFFPGEGHWSIYAHWQEILTTLASSGVLLYQETLPVEVTAAIPESNPSKEALVSTECRAMDIADASANLPQKLGPSPGIDKPVATETAKPTPRKTAKSRTKVAAHTPANVSKEPKPTREAAKPAAIKTAKGRTKVVAGTPAAPPDEGKSQREKARLTSRRPARPKAAAIAPISASAEIPHSAQKPAKSTSKRSPSRHKAAKEAVLV